MHGPFSLFLRPEKEKTGGYFHLKSVTKKTPNLLDRKNSKAMELHKNSSARWALPDNIRGLTLISMIAYHACWDLVYIFGKDWDWYRSAAAYLWQQSICWTFLLLSGFCWSLGRRPLWRGLEVSAGGALVTAATLLFMPENRVVFGVLTLLGASMLLLIPLDGFLRKIPPQAGLAGAFGLFFLLRNVNGGFLGFEAWRPAALPEGLYSGLVSAFFGFPPADFFSTDYFSLLPWFFLFLAGYFLHKLFPSPLPAGGRPWPLLHTLGLYSLPIYLLHQPVVYGVLFLLDWAGLL